MHQLYLDVLAEDAYPRWKDSASLLQDPFMLEFKVLLDSVETNRYSL